MSSEDKSTVEKFFTEVPNTSPPPVKHSEEYIASYDDAMEFIEQRIKRTDPDLYRDYKSGKLLKTKFKHGSDVLRVVVNCYIDHARDKLTKNISNPEELQKEMIKLKNYHRILEDIVNLTKDLNFNVDVNSVLCIIYGIVHAHLKEHIKHD